MCIGFTCSDHYLIVRNSCFECEGHFHQSQHCWCKIDRLIGLSMNLDLEVKNPTVLHPDSVEQELPFSSLNSCLRKILNSLIQSMTTTADNLGFNEQLVQQYLNLLASWTLDFLLTVTQTSRCQNMGKHIVSKLCSFDSLEHLTN